MSDKENLSITGEGNTFVLRETTSDSESHLEVDENFNTVTIHLDRVRSAVRKEVAEKAAQMVNELAAEGIHEGPCSIPFVRWIDLADSIRALGEVKE